MANTSADESGHFHPLHMKIREAVELAGRKRQDFLPFP
jgi:hypothetical protein